MSISTTYLLNVALHAAILSVFASLLLMALRQARHRSVAAIAGLLAIGFLPWLTALRPARPVAAPAPEIQTPSVVLPTWTLMTLPGLSEIPTPAEATVAAERFVFPDPLTCLTTLWAPGAGIGLLTLGIASLRVRSWRKSLLPLGDTTWQSLQAISPQVPDRNHFLLSETTASPCVTGLFRPRIVLPRFLLELGSEEELRWAVRHEIAHWQAGDSRWMLLFALIRCANWWNPLVHKLVSRWSDTREQLCDLHAIGISDSRADYGEFLIAMARKITNPPALTIAMAKRPHAVRLKRRIVCLLGSERDYGRPVGKGFIGISSVLLVMIALGVSVLRIGAEEGSEPSSTVPAIEAITEQAVQGLTEEASSEPPLAKPSAVTIPDPPAPAGNPVGQVKFSNKLLMTFARPAMRNGSVLSDGEFKSYLRSMSQTKGVYLMTAPLVSARFGQAVTVEVIREVVGKPEQVAARGSKSPTPFTGIKFDSVANLEGNQAKLKFDANYHYIPGLPQPIEDTRPQLAAGIDPDTIKVAKQSITALLKAGETLCSDLGEIEPGKFLQVFTTILPIDATGRPLDGFVSGKPLPDVGRDGELTRIRAGGLPETPRNDRPKGPLPSEDVRGKLKLVGMMVELPLKSAGPTYKDELRRLVPSSSKDAYQLRKAAGAKLRMLKNVEIPLNVSKTPWPEFPGLKVSAIASSDLQLITISSHAVGDGVEGLPNTWQDRRAGSTMMFRLGAEDPSIERCLLITIEAEK